MPLYAAKLKASAKPVSDLSKPELDKKEQAKLKRQEKAKAKKEAQQKEQEELRLQQENAQKELLQKEAELKALEEKKKAQNEKRKLKRAEKKLTSVTPPASVTESVESMMVETTPKPKKSRSKKKVTIEEQVDQEVAKLNTPEPSPEPEINEKKKRSRNEDDPPAWFRKYVAGVKNEESMLRSPKKPKREVAKEADQVAAQQWGNGLVRDRVRNEVDQHMSRMYQMIFNRRGFDGL